MDEAKATFESVVRMETNQNKKAAGLDIDAAEDDMDVDEGRKFKALKYHGSWSYKAIKQLVKLHIRALDGKSVMKDYTRMLCVAGSPDAAISPNALEKGVNGMLDRVSNIMTNPPSDVTSDSSAHTLARDVYGTIDSDFVSGCILLHPSHSKSDLTIEAFHPKTGVSPNERLWFKTNLKYGQLLYEMNETTRLRSVIKDLLVASGQPADILDGSSSMDISSSDNSTSGTQLMEIAALQIQLYSKLKVNAFVSGPRGIFVGRTWSSLNVFTGYQISPGLLLQGNVCEECSPSSSHDRPHSRDWRENARVPAQLRRGLPGILSGLQVLR